MTSRQGQFKILFQDVGIVKLIPTDYSNDATVANQCARYKIWTVFGFHIKIPKPRLLKELFFFLIDGPESEGLSAYVFNKYMMQVDIHGIWHLVVQTYLSC